MEPLEVTTVGEALTVMDPLSEGPLKHVARFEKHYGGAELNVWSGSRGWNTLPAGQAA